ncbi:UPF0606 protein KIAA1549L homolog [Lissotriton helveticus]
MAPREAGRGAAHLRVAWSGACGQRAAVTGGAWHLLLGIGLLLLRGLEAAATEDNTQSTLDSSTPLWPSAEPQNSSTSSGRLSWSTDFDTSELTAANINSSSMDPYTISPASTQGVKTNVTQVDIPSGLTIISTSQAAEDTTNVSGLTPTSMTIKHTITTPPAMTYSSATVPSLSSLFDTFSISESALSASGSVSPVSSLASPTSPSVQSLSSSTFFPTSTYSSSVTAPLNDITPTHADTLTFEVPFSTQSQSSVVALGVFGNTLNSYSTDNVNQDMSQYFTSSSPESASYSAINFNTDTMESITSEGGFYTDTVVPPSDESKSYSTKVMFSSTFEHTSPLPASNSTNSVYTPLSVTTVVEESSEISSTHTTDGSGESTTQTAEGSGESTTQTTEGSGGSSTQTTGVPLVFSAETTMSRADTTLSKTDPTYKYFTDSLFTVQYTVKEESSGVSSTQATEGSGEISTQTAEGSGESTTQTTVHPLLFSEETTHTRVDTAVPKTDHTYKFFSDSVLTTQYTVNGEQSNRNTMLSASSESESLSTNFISTAIFESKSSPPSDSILSSLSTNRAYTTPSIATNAEEASGERSTQSTEGSGEISTQTSESSKESITQTTAHPRLFSEETTQTIVDTDLPKTDHTYRFFSDSVLTTQYTVNGEQSNRNTMLSASSESESLSTNFISTAIFESKSSPPSDSILSSLSTNRAYTTPSIATNAEEASGERSTQSTEGSGEISTQTSESSGESITQTTAHPRLFSEETTQTIVDTDLPKTDHTYRFFSDSVLTTQYTVNGEQSNRNTMLSASSESESLSTNFISTAIFESKSSPPSDSILSSLSTNRAYTTPSIATNAEEASGERSTQSTEGSGEISTHTTAHPTLFSEETTESMLDTDLPKTDHTYRFFSDSVLTTQYTVNSEQSKTNTMLSASSESESLSTNFISTAIFESISSVPSGSILSSLSTNSAHTTPSIATNTEESSGEGPTQITKGTGESSTQTTDVPTAFSEAVTMTRVHITTNSAELTLPITEGASIYSSIDYTRVPAGQATTPLISSNTEIPETKSSAHSNTYENVSDYATTSFVFTTDYGLSLSSQENVKSSGTSITTRPTGQTSNPSLPSSTSHISSQEGITNENTVITATESPYTVSLSPTTYSSGNLLTSQFPTDEISSSNTEIHVMTTSGQPLYSLTTSSLISNNEMSDTRQTVYSHLTSNLFKRSTWGTAPTSEDLIPSISVETGSTNSLLPGTESHPSTRHADLSTIDSTGIVSSNSTSNFIAATTGPSLVSTVSPMHTYLATQPPTLTHSFPSSTKHASTVLSTNLTSSVITVPSSPVSHDMSTEVSSDVSAATHISPSKSSVATLNTTFAGGKTTQTMTALTHSTLTPLSHVQSTSYLTSHSKSISAIQTPVTTDFHVTSAPVNMSTLTSSSTSHLFTMTNKNPTPTTVHSTTHSSMLATLLPVVSENPTLSEVTKTSTAYQRTISAALTSITASAKATTLPAATVTNTTAVATNTTTMSTLLKTTPSSAKCELSQNLLLNTVLVVTPKLMTDNVNMMNNISNGLKEALGKALQNTVQVQINKTLIESSGVDLNTITIGYFVKVILKNVINFYIPSAVTDSITNYGNSSFTKDIKNYVPSLRYVTVLASPRISPPGEWFQLKTVLQVVGLQEDVHSCSFVQSMEQKLLSAFQDALTKNTAATSNVKTVQIVSTSLQANVLTLIYAASNSSGLMNGTVSSRLLNLLSAEEVWSYLDYPPKIIAEPLKYPVLSTADSTRPYWVYTVIQGVNDTLLKSESFARLMEQRLGQLFVMSQQQGRRFKRATDVGDYTVQMVSIQRVQGPKNPAQLTYYALKNGEPMLGSTASKQLSTIDSQTMALTLGYVVLVQVESAENNPPSNMWIIAAVLAPIAVVTVIIIIIAAVLCRKSKNDFKGDSMANMPPRPKPVQGFDFAKKHLGQQGAEDEVLPVTQETVVPPLTISQDAHDGSTGKTANSTGTRKSQSPSENGSVISNESGQPSSGRSTPQKVTAQQKATKEETRRRNGFKISRKIVPSSDEDVGSMLYENSSKMVPDPFDTSSGSAQLTSIRSVGVPPSHPASDRSQESAVIAGEVNKALKQKSDIEHYRNKLRLKAKKKGYYDFPPIDGSKSLTERKRKMYEKKQKEIDSVLDPDTDVSSPFAEPKNRQPPTKSVVYRSRQSLNSPSPGETEMDLLVTRERPRRGIRNSGYDTEPEVIEETNVDRVKESRRYAKSRQMKGHSETSTLSSQPSIDEVRQQMHMLLEEAFSLASAGHAGTKRQPEPYASAQQLPYSEVVTSAPGTMTRPRGAVQWVPTYGPETYQYSLPRPTYRFTQLPEMVMGSPPPPVPPRTGPVAVPSLRRSTSDMGSSKTRLPESSGADPKHDTVAYAPALRNPVPMPPMDQSASNYSAGDTVPAVFAIPANRSGFTGYFVPRPPTSYRNQPWVSYTGESELPGQWADSVPLPGYIEAYPRPHYPQSSPSRLPRQYSQPTTMHPGLEQAAVLSAAASQQSLADTDTPDTSLTNLSTAALVKAIREEVAKLAKKQTDRFEFQV